MKVLVLNPPYVDDFCRSARWAAKSRGRVQRHPDWLLILTAVLEKAGHDVKFVDGAALNMKKGEVEDMARQFRPELAVLHTTTPSIYNDIDYAKTIKNLTGAMTALAGPHVSALPADTLLIDRGAVDAVARGEYDYTIRDIASGTSLSDVAGIDWMDGETVRHNPDRPLLDVTELPFPAWHHIRPEWYYDAGKKFPFLTLISGRGCFGRCMFCRDTQLMYGRKLRYREPAQVVDEMEYDMKLFPQLPKERIDRLIDEGLKGFYLRPRQMARMLLNIRSMADLKRKLYGFKAFLNYFGKKKGTK